MITGASWLRPSKLILFTFALCLLALANPQLAVAQTDTDQTANDTSEAASDDASSNEEEGANQEPEAQAEAEPVPPPQPGAAVEWYRPELGQSKRKKRTRVIISGTTTPKSKVYISTKKIAVITRKNKVKYLRAKKAIVGKRISRADDKGYFEIHLDLPNMKVQLPIKIKPPKGQGRSKRYQLNVAVKKQEVKITNQDNLKRSPAFAKKYAIWLGAGFNYLRYTQTSTITSSDGLAYESFKMPSFFLKGRVGLTDNWDLGITFKMSPGEAESAPGGTQVTNGAYNWTIFGLEGTHYPSNWRSRLGGLDTKLGYRVGVQHHIVPFLTAASISPTSVTVETNSVSMFTAGMQYMIDHGRSLTYEIFMRYQYPLAVGDQFEMTPKFAFDGSLGLIYKFADNWRVGGFWYGQWHEYDFSTVLADSSSVTGSQSLFFSNIDVRLGYAF